MKKIKWPPRLWFTLGAVTCFAMLGVGAYFQFVEYLEPCPLCISQRIMILLTGLIFLIAAIHNPAACWRKIYAMAGTATAMLGAGISSRHVWLQNLPPDQIPECGPGLMYIFENFPLTETIRVMLNGTGECADVLWTFLGLSIPSWTFVAFLLLATLSLLQYWNEPTTKKED